MKCAEYYLENHKIEIFSSFFGKEKILVNNKPVSELNSSIRRPHRFRLGNNNYDVSSKLHIAEPSGKEFRFRKNGKALSLVNLKSQSSKVLLLLIVALAISFGFFLGTYLYRFTAFAEL